MICERRKKEKRERDKKRERDVKGVMIKLAKSVGEIKSKERERES